MAEGKRHNYIYIKFAIFSVVFTTTVVVMNTSIIGNNIIGNRETSKPAALAVSLENLNFLLFFW